MKTLKLYIENHITESLLDDEDVLSGPERDKRIIETWIKENYNISRGLKISDDLIVDCEGSVIVGNLDIMSLTNGLFRWGKVSGYFDCSDCENLKSLKGAPEKIKNILWCEGCKNFKLTDSDYKKYKIRS